MNGTPGPSRLTRYVFAAAWASFLTAALLEALVFAVVDPAELHWFGAAPVALPVQAVYTLGFLIFWGVAALGMGLLLLLVNLPDDSPPPRHASGWPR